MTRAVTRRRRTDRSNSIEAQLLNDETIDRLLRDAAKVRREVEESLRSSFQIPESARGLVIR